MTASTYVFPGQGSQYPGMGRDLAWCAPGARGLIPAAAALSGLPVADLMDRADAATISDPEVAQVLVFVASSVLATELRLRGHAPRAVAGHSLGEYTALVAAGCLGWDTALVLVAARGRAMAAAARQSPGTMAALVGLPLDAVRELCAAESRDGELAVVANVNSPRQAVVSGTEKAVEGVMAHARNAGAIRARRLPVGGAYHSPLMDAARREMEPVLRGTPLREPDVPFVSSVTGRPVTDVRAYTTELVGQITRPVLWREVVERLAPATATYVEVGPGRVLTGLGREMHRDACHLSASDAGRGAASSPAAIRPTGSKPREPQR